MHRGAGWAGIVLRAGMRLLPVALGVPPQGLQWQAQPGRRRWIGQRGAECGQIHVQPSNSRRILRTAESGVVSTVLPVAAATASLARARLNCASAITSQPAIALAGSAAARS